MEACFESLCGVRGVRTGEVFVSLLEAGVGLLRGVEDAVPRLDGHGTSEAQGSHGGLGEGHSGEHVHLTAHSGHGAAADQPTARLHHQRVGARRRRGVVVERCARRRGEGRQKHQHGPHPQQSIAPRGNPVTPDRSRGNVRGEHHRRGAARCSPERNRRHLDGDLQEDEVEQQQAVQQALSGLSERAEGGTHPRSRQWRRGARPGGRVMSRRAAARLLALRGAARRVLAHALPAPSARTARENADLRSHSSSSLQHHYVHEPFVSFLRAVIP